MNAVRERRLLSDLTSLQALAEDSAGRLVIRSVNGPPPDTYRLTFYCRSLIALNGDAPTFGGEHAVRLYLPATYPAMGPVATVLSPLLHPHIWPNRTVCLGAWSPAEKLDSVVQRIALLLTFDPAWFNWRSIADESVAPWTRANMHLFPLDAPLLAATPQGKVP